VTEDELVALLALKGILIDVCWLGEQEVWSGALVWTKENIVSATEYSDSRARVLHEIAIATLRDAYDGTGIKQNEDYREQSSPATSAGATADHRDYPEEQDTGRR
jgi:hypothetical protein